MSARLTQIAPWLNVEDADISLAFYRDGLGFRVIESRGAYGETHWCMLQREGATVVLNRNDHGDRAQRLGRHTWGDIVLYFYCTNAHSEWADLKDRGIEVGEIERSEARMDEFLVRDPDGYVLVFGSSAPSGS